jgi:hypothetical protein
VRALSLSSIQRPANEVLDKALPWIEQTADRPFFAWIHLRPARPTGRLNPTRRDTRNTLQRRSRSQTVRSQGSFDLTVPPVRPNRRRGDGRSRALGSTARERTASSSTTVTRALFPRGRPPADGRRW